MSLFLVAAGGPRYEIIPGNVVDVSTISNVMEKLRQYGYNVQYALGDAAYSCPSNIEKLVLAGIDFLTRLNPAYDLYKDTLDAHMEELKGNSHTVMFNGRIVTVIKTTAVIAKDADTGNNVEGYIYLCRDHNAWHSKASHLMNSRKFRSMDPDKIQVELEKYGIFALVSTKELAESEILKEYYIRQGIEQFFDYAKNYANYLPVRNHNVETLRGHLLLSFIATFFLVLIKNRLKILDTSYVAIPNNLKEELDDGTPYVELDTQQGTELMIRQEKQMDIFKGSPAVLFSELQFQMADVFDDEIIPSIQVAGATQFYRAYRIGVPEYVMLKGPERQPVPRYRDGEGNQCTRRVAFARRSSLTPEQLEERRKKGELEKLEALAAKHGMKVMSSAQEETKAADSIATNAEQTAPPKRGKGRPKGSKKQEDLGKRGRSCQAGSSRATAAKASPRPSKRIPEQIHTGEACKGAVRKDDPAENKISQKIGLEKNHKNNV